MNNQSATINVLLVEDNPGDARLIREMLTPSENVHFSLEYADGLGTCLTRLTRGGVDVLLLDLGLRDSVGFETFSRVYAKAAHVPIIVLTDLRDEALAVKAVKEGAQDYLTKRDADRRVLTRAIRYAIERKREEQQLRLQATALSAAANAIVITDSSGQLLWANAAFSRLSGYAPDEVRGQNLRFLQSGRQDRPFYERLWNTITSGQVWQGELVNRRKNGSLYTEEMTITPARDEYGSPTRYVAIKQDITERQGLERQYRTLVEAAHDVIVIVNQAGRIEYINNAGSERYGVPATRIVGQPIGKLVPAESASELLAAIRKVLETGDPTYQEIRLSLLDREAWFGSWLVLLKRTASEPEAVLAVGRDITEQKKVAQQLLQAQKMDAIGQLAGGVAHDFNNLLTTILGYADLLLKAVPEGDAQRKFLDEIQQAGLSAAGLTRQLLAFSRQQVLEHAVLDLNEVASSLIRMVRRLIGENIDVTTRLASDLGRIKGDAVQIEQVLLNLALNARDAMHGGGTLTIETTNVDADEHFAESHPGVTPGPYVMLAVSDTGHGMDERTQSHLFEPFFTTKEQGKGTGLGLATAYGIVKQSGGVITVYSEVGHGSTFRVYLPRVEGVAAPPVSVSADAAMLQDTGTETVLVVEDSDKLRKLARTILEVCGYTVLEAPNGDEALGISDRHQGVIHLLLTDVVMPGMNGRALADRLLVLRPATKVLFTSGYTDSAIFESGVLDAGTAFLEKPYRPMSLARKVREVLDAPPLG